MIYNLKLDYIMSTDISTENIKNDNSLNTFDVNTWIYNKDDKFFVGVPEVLGVGGDDKKKNLLVTNISIVKPYKYEYLIVRNYYVFKFDEDKISNIKCKYVGKMVEKFIIESAKNGHLSKILQMIYDNNNVYFSKDAV